MGSSDFYIDYNIHVPGTGNAFKRETEQRLQELASTHVDMAGVAVSLENVAGTTTQSTGGSGGDLLLGIY